jgi:serine/threonine protein phosphatase 1
MKQRRIVIGDVHGHYDSLMTLLETIAPSSEDQVYFLGDLIDRGSQSYQVVEFVKNSGYQCLLGNHEQMLVDIVLSSDLYPPALEAWLYSGGKNTIKSYGTKGINSEHIQWMQQLPTHLDLGDLWLVHAGVHPNIPLKDQNANHFCWVRQEFHSSPYAFFKDKLIITGHTITFTLPGVAPGQIAQGAGWLGIDTGAYHPRSGWLTGLDTNNWIVYQVNTVTNLTRQMPLADLATVVNYQQDHQRPLRTLPYDVVQRYS